MKCKYEEQENERDFNKYAVVVLYAKISNKYVCMYVQKNKFAKLM